MKSVAQEIIQIGKLIYDKGYNAGKDGNISVRLDNDHIMITASGALLGFLTIDDLIIVNNNGDPVDETTKKPSSEIILHTEIYKERPDINAVIHAHAPYSIALSMLDIDTEHHLYSTAAGPIPITETALPSCSDSWEKIQPFVKKRSKAILKRHGLVAWGKDLMTTFVKLEETEHFAKSLVHAFAVKKIEPISQEIQDKLFIIWGIK